MGGSAFFKDCLWRSEDSFRVCHIFSLIELCGSQKLNLGESTLTYIIFFFNCNHMNLESAGKRETQLKTYLNVIVMWACF